MRRVYGVKVTRLTLGELAICHLARRRREADRRIASSQPRPE